MINIYYQKESLKHKLVRPENIPILEEILAQKSSELERLKKAKEEGKLRFGRKIKQRQELETIVKEVKEEVDAFWGVSGIDLPNCDFVKLRENKFALGIVSAAYGLTAINLCTAGLSLTTTNDLDVGPIVFNLLLGATGMFVHYSSLLEIGYDAKGQKIRLEKTPRESLVTDFAHEYTHHLQHQFPKQRSISAEYVPFMEGHARGVQRNIGERYRQREENDAFIWGNLNYDVSELKSVYRWLCKIAGKKVSSSLLSTRTPHDGANAVYLALYKEPTPHALGNALMLIHEAQYGNNIYRKMLHGEYIF